MPDLTPDRIEQIKLRATSINAVGLALIITGTITPILGALYGTNKQFGLRGALLAFGCLVVGVFLHYAALYVLKGLKP